MTARLRAARLISRPRLASLIFCVVLLVAFALSIYSLCEVSISIFGPVCYLAGRHSTQFIHNHSIAAEFFLVSYFQVLNPTCLRFSFTISTWYIQSLYVFSFLLLFFGRLSWLSQITKRRRPTGEAATRRRTWRQKRSRRRVEEEQGLRVGPQQRSLCRKCGAS